MAIVSQADRCDSLQGARAEMASAKDQPIDSTPYTTGIRLMISQARSMGQRVVFSRLAVLSASPLLDLEPFTTTLRLFLMPFFFATSLDVTSPSQQITLKSPRPR
ncbi:uncharacterized protein ARMOST_14282 [Armillaria ostoyae]|uniref:Uncharacterized protein n=1 Tax=Armillaria ostoyae TaxID=47428 RepID=A0A284RQ39_ARMOS|nr:uncharacterized protein ARMOST_14282 [Armillaria ostoyae]